MGLGFAVLHCVSVYKFSDCFNQKSRIWGGERGE